MIVSIRLQDGWLSDQSNPKSKVSKPVLRYDVGDGTFQLSTASYVKLLCDMQFWMYPFDIQPCMVRMRTAKDMSRQVLNTCKHFSKNFIYVFKLTTGALDLNQSKVC